VTLYLKQLRNINIAPSMKPAINIPPQLQNSLKFPGFRPSGYPVSNFCPQPGFEPATFCIATHRVTTRPFNPKDTEQAALHSSKARACTRAYASRISKMETSCCSNGSDRPHRCRRKNRAIVLAKWPHCGPHPIHSLGPCESAPSKRHLDRHSRFCRTHCLGQHVERHRASIHA